jgi:hypothetical protein
MRTSAYITHKMRVMRTHSTIYELAAALLQNGQKRKE